MCSSLLAVPQLSEVQVASAHQGTFSLNAKVGFSFFPPVVPASSEKSCTYFITHKALNYTNVMLSSAFGFKLDQKKKSPTDRFEFHFLTHSHPQNSHTSRFLKLFLQCFFFDNTSSSACVFSLHSIQRL